MKKILLSVMSLGLVAAVAVFVTQAYFSDEEKSVGNTFQAGKLDLKVDYKSTYNGKDSVGWELKDLEKENSSTLRM